MSMMDDIQMQNSLPGALNLNEAQDRNSSKPQSLARKNWDDLKPMIRELYLDQGQTIKQLIKYLEEHHGFRPTKKQLLYRMRGWGFEKNVKKNERRAIIEKFGPELGKVEFEAQIVRGRKLDEAKLNRWMKLENVNFEESPTEENKAACVQTSAISSEENFGPANQGPEVPPSKQISNYEEQTEFNSQVQGSKKVSILQYNDYSFDWNSVDVLGSPGLTKLIGALTIEECDIPFLDLASDSLETVDIEGCDLLDLCRRSDSAQGESSISRMQSWSTSLSTSIDAFQTSGKLWKVTHFALHSELDPFPTSSSQPYVVRPRFFSPDSPLALSESECKNKLQRLKHMQNTEIIALTEAMGTMAEKYFTLRCYSIAETWFRRVVRAKQHLDWYKPHQTLWACLRVASCIQYQSRYREANQLLESLHGTIERVLAADHAISVASKRLKAGLLRDLGSWKEEEDVRRQVLQISLNTFGMRHPDTIASLEDLGAVLDLADRHDEAQYLLETSIRFRIATVKNSRDYFVKSKVLSDMSALAGSLNSEGRHDESEKVLDFAHILLGDASRMEYWECFEYHLERARTYKFQERFEDSAKILRGLLKYHQDAMAPVTIMESMRVLGEVLVETGHHREAATWRKKEYFLHVKTYGLTHRWTMACCASVGSCYANQGRYDDEKLFLEEVIEMLTLSSEDSDSRADCIETIKTWMMENSEEWSAETSDSLGSSSETTESDGEVDDEGMSDISDSLDYEDMSDVPDPLDY